MNINNFYWWFLILLNFASYFTYSFGNISKGNSKLLIEFVGGALFFLSFVAMFIFFGLWSGIALIIFAFVLVAPIVGLLMAKIEKKLYGHAHLHPELKDYNMSNMYISFFHNSDNYIEEFSPKDEVKPSFYWFGERYYNHYNITTRFKYFYLFVKNPKKDGLRLRERYEGLGFNSLYSHYLKYKKGRDQNLQKGIYNWLSPEPANLISFSIITPDLILEFEDERPNSAVVIKPEGYKGLKITLFDNNNMPIQFTDIPEILQILPKIRHSFPFVEPKQDKGDYVYEDWLPMVIKREAKNLVRALNDGAMKNRKTY